MVERLILNRWVGLGGLGIFYHSQSYRAIFQQGYKALAKVFCPELLEAYQKGTISAQLTARYRNGLMLMALGGLLCIGLAEPVINILTHGKFNSAAQYVSAWYGVVLCFYWGMPYNQFLVSKKQTGYLSKVIIGSVLFAVVFIILTIPSIGTWGALGGGISICFLIVWFNRRKALTLGCPDSLGKMVWPILVIHYFLVFGSLTFGENELARGLLLAVGFLAWGWHFHVVEYIRRTFKPNLG